MLNVIILVSIAIAVAVGYKTGFNIGMFAMVFAYFIGCFVMGMSTKEVVGGWPLSTMFVIFAVTLFFGFAMVNKTLEKTARWILYSCRRFPGMLPFILYFTTAATAALGAGLFAVMAIMSSVTHLICKETKMDRLIAGVAVCCGALSGSNFFISSTGLICRGLMNDFGFSDQSLKFITIMFGVSILYSLLIIAGYRFIPKENRNIGKGVTFDKPEPFTREQKINLFLILAMVVLLLALPMLHSVLPNLEVLTFINSKVDVGLIAICFAVICLFFRLAPWNEVLLKVVPWNTIIMICGVGMLINVAIEAGTIDMLANLLGSSVPVVILPVGVSLIASIMSFFSSASGVVCPTLFPMVPVLAQTSGLSPLLLFSCILLGAQASAVSPFSTCGGMFTGAADTEEEQNKIFHRLLSTAVPVGIVFCMVFCLLLSFVIR